MHEPLLARAALPAPTVCLGLVLRRYCLGHELFLIRENNPLVMGGEVSDQHLIEAVLICAQTFEQCQGMIEDHLLPVKLWIWKKRARFSRLDWLAEQAVFRAYRADGCLEFPPCDVTRPNSAATPRLPGAPFLLRLHSFLMERLRISEAEAWNYPCGLAKMRWATHWEQEGGFEIYNEHDAQFDRFIAEQEAQEQEAPAPVKGKKKKCH